MRKTDVKIGDCISVKEGITGFYSEYGGNPVIRFEPGMIGTVGAVDVPSVRRGKVSYVCVDFSCTATGKIERAAVLYSNIVLIGPSKKSRQRR